MPTPAKAKVSACVVSITKAVPEVFTVVVFFPSMSSQSKIPPDSRWRIPIQLC